MNAARDIGSALDEPIDEDDDGVGLDIIGDGLSDALPIALWALDVLLRDSILFL